MFLYRDAADKAFLSMTVAILISAAGWERCRDRIVSADRY